MEQLHFPFYEHDKLEEGARTILEGLRELGLNIDDENFKGTPARVARMYREVLAGIGDTEKEVEHILSSAFPCQNNNLVLVRDIEAFSLCPHHLLPVHYNIHVAYLPNGKVIGLSKLARLVDVLARRPVLQEQLVEDISTSLMRIEGCMGAACIAEGVHYCMVMRGVKQSRAKTVASSMKGAFLTEDQIKQELLKLVFH